MTLCLLILLVFFAREVLPGDLGRTILCPWSISMLDELNDQLGLDRPLVAQYGTWEKALLFSQTGVDFYRPILLAGDRSSSRNEVLRDFSAPCWESGRQ